MLDGLDSASITPTNFDACLDRYLDYVPKKLTDLDQFRFVTVPAQLKERRDTAGGAWLEKEEVQQLVDWKLKHGTFRPSLAKLVASNSSEDVESTTRSAFNNEKQTPRQMVERLAKLKGIGPATASLIASCHTPNAMPFFSDELFRWLHWDGKNADGSATGIKQTGQGWSRQIGYTMKEYDSLRVKGLQIQERMKTAGRNVNFLEMEKVAYVLGKEKAAVKEAEPSDAVPTKGNKRKATGQDIPEVKSKRVRGSRKTG